MKIIFMGTHDFSQKILDVLIQNFDVRLVVSQPDRKIGRKRILTKTLTKELAEQYNIDVFQPEKLKTDYQKILDTECDLIVTASYGQYVPKEVLDHPKFGSINVHASLLPKYRGASPIHRAIQNGDPETGVTIMAMAEKLDAGDIIAQRAIPIEDTDTVDSMFEKLAEVGMRMAVYWTYKIEQGLATYTPQDESLVTYAPLIKREEEAVDFKQTAKEIHNHIRGFDSFPGTYTIFDDIKIKLFPGEITNKPSTVPGTIEQIDKTGLYVSTASTQYKITELQVTGKKRMLVRDFLNGNQLLSTGQKFNT